MSTNRVDISRATVTVEPTHERQTHPPATPFRDVLATSVGVLFSGAEVATSVMGGPVLAAAVHQAGARVVQGMAGHPPGEGTAAGAGGAGGVGGRSAVAASAGGDSGEIAHMHTMQKESQAFNLQLLALQEEIQNENRRFSTLTNVLRAQHDTAKAAVSNIRS